MQFLLRYSDFVWHFSFLKWEEIICLYFASFQILDYVFFLLLVNAILCKRQVIQGQNSWWAINFKYIVNYPNPNRGLRLRLRYPSMQTVSGRPVSLRTLILLILIIPTLFASFAEFRVIQPRWWESKRMASMDARWLRNDVMINWSLPRHSDKGGKSLK